MSDDQGAPRRMRTRKRLDALQAAAARAQDRLRTFASDTGANQFDSGGRGPGSAANLGRLGRPAKPPQTADFSRFGLGNLSRMSERARRHRAMLDRPDRECRQASLRQGGLAPRGTLGSRLRPQSEAQRAQAETARNTRAMLAIMQNRPTQGWQ